MRELLYSLLALAFSSPLTAQQDEWVKVAAGDEEGPIAFPPEAYVPGVFPEQNENPAQSEDSSFDNLVVGGQSSFDAPEWMVFPSRDTDRNCGGSLVSPDTVVTAAHCYDDCNDPFFDCKEPCPTQVRIGSLWRNVGGQVVDVLPYSCVLHPQFTREPNRYDVAIFKLAEPVALDKYATINGNPSFPSYPFSAEAGMGPLFTAYGFGRFSNNVNSGAEILREINLRYWHDCSSQQGGDQYYAEHHVCAWQEVDEGTCQGDSGGPLVFRSDGVDFLAGIASFLGSDKCATVHMDYFSRVGTYSEWILEQVNAQDIQPGCSWASAWRQRIRQFGLIFQGWF